jgi:hypothetical protein
VADNGSKGHVPAGKYARNRTQKQHRRFYITQPTSMLLDLTRAFAPNNDSYDDFMEMIILYGLAYVNEHFDIKMTDWISKMRLPTLADVDSNLGLTTKRK